MRTSSTNARSRAQPGSSAAADFVGVHEFGFEEQREPEAPIEGLLALLVTDLEHFTALVRELGDEAARRVMRAHNRLLRGCLRGHDGREITHTGDGIIAVFRSLSAALCCAAQMQQMLEELRLPEAACRLRMRIGVHAGEPLPEDGRLFGTCINTAVRVCSAASPSHVVVSDVVCLLASGRAFKFAPLGLIALKGFDSPMALSEFLWRD